MIGLSYGGTNANLTAVSGGIVYSNASALAISSAGTSGQILTSGGTGAPTWVDQSSLSVGTSANADLLDNLDSTSFLRSDASDTFESGNTLTINGTLDVNGTASFATTTLATTTISQLTLGNLSGVLKASSGLISGGATTSDLPEGSNLYYTQARFDTAFSNKTTDDLTEGTTNLYYTDARARAALSGTAPISYNSSTGEIGLSTPLATSYGGTGKDSSSWTGFVKVSSGTWATSTIDISDDTNLAVSGTLLNLTDDTLSINEGTLTNNDLCTYVSGTGLVCNTAIGTDVQAYDAGLQSIASLTTNADQMLYLTGTDTYSTTTLTSFGKFTVTLIE